MNLIENGRFNGYTGSRMYRVTHPDHETVSIAAPSQPAAICVAATLWGEQWQDRKFYSACSASHIIKSGRMAME